MKHIASYLAGFSLLAITALSCTKEGHDKTRQQAEAPQVMKATVPAGQTYVFNLGRANGANIQRQAQHYQVSEVATAADGNVAYKYSPVKGYAGADEVTLQQTVTSTSGGGCSGSRNNSDKTTAVKTIVIRFDVAN